MSEQTVLEVDDMTCGSCARSINALLREVDGVSDIDIALATKQVTITHDAQRVSPQQLRDVIATGGYFPRLVEDEHACCAVG